MDNTILNVKDLRVTFHNRQGDNVAVDGINFSVKKGEIFGIVGESGCGKSMTSLATLRLISRPGEIAGGQIEVDGQDILAMSERKLQRTIRGSKIAMIFQEPMTSLNPLLTIGDQIIESLCKHRKMSKGEARTAAIEQLRQVGIPLPERRMNEYPHTLSGGMRQRVMIAIAMCCHPNLLIADEPTTALDVTIQAQILKLMKKLRDQEGTAILLISHDLGVIANMCDRIAVMYCGTIVEQGIAQEVLGDPHHPYTKGLIASLPSIQNNKEHLHSIPGTVPKIISGAVGCRFADRCEHCIEKCRKVTPQEINLGEEHSVSCLLYEGV